MTRVAVVVGALVGIAIGFAWPRREAAPVATSTPRPEPAAPDPGVGLEAAERENRELKAALAEPAGPAAPDPLDSVAWAKLAATTRGPVPDVDAEAAWDELRRAGDLLEKDHGSRDLAAALLAARVLLARSGDDPAVAAAIREAIPGIKAKIAAAPKAEFELERVVQGGEILNGFLEGLRAKFPDLPLPSVFSASDASDAEGAAGRAESPAGRAVEEWAGRLGLPPGERAALEALAARYVAGRAAVRASGLPVQERLLEHVRRRIEFQRGLLEQYGGDAARAESIRADRSMWAQVDLVVTEYAPTGWTR